MTQQQTPNNPQPVTDDQLDLEPVPFWIGAVSGADAYTVTDAGRAYLDGWADRDRLDGYAEPDDESRGAAFATGYARRAGAR